MYAQKVHQVSAEMKLQNITTMRCMTIACITLGVCILTLFYLPIETYAQHSYIFLSSINVTSKITFLSRTRTNVRGVNDKIINRLNEITEIVKVKGINCSALFYGSNKENATMETKSKNPDILINDTSYPNLTSNCQNFITSRGYIMSSLTQEEEEFPLAYSIIVMKEAEMVERLLRAVYRPQNYYCIHVDLKSSEAFFTALTSVAKCFPNVFLLETRINVTWGAFSVLEPELLCMKALWKYSKWKYFINLTGQEFPLRTNYELVKILTAYRGASDIETNLKCNDKFKFRWKNNVAPYGLRISTGAVHITASRAYVDYILHSEIAHGLLEWLKPTFIPDETFFATLNANPRLGINGTYTGNVDSCDSPTKRPFITRYKMWQWGNPCAGKFVRYVCILTSGDLIRLHNATKLFANKFYLNEDRICIGCLEEMIFNNTRDEALGIKTFDTTYYSNLDFVKNQLQ